ncbi:uncharacterized protein MYCFIDRAFT_184908 [Pseudocercospora fijiensis CIRAD86]|uniref:Pal1 cell morphology protein n=1 Tax=Pseudocercospora fijiensis (strain CIRAD86) TaxID=383855 RepID=N1Q6N2_PSEFD|nr:uncharacterized protein MYCFIDRAFT_184908 [Pseudocercospora fijiensis CIRAD86]EME88119.1 hypothetical protein MYCFIDRAFT_184908 [Pseudocercospora fijiensis CIRAD86]
MALFAGATAQAHDRQPSPAPVGLSLNLSSNNPFRNRAASPNPSPSTPVYLTAAGTPPLAVQRPTRPMSTNPFLDDSELSQPDSKARANAAALPEDIFVSLRLACPATSPASFARLYLVRPPTNGAPPRPIRPAPSYRAPERPSGDRPPRPARDPASPNKNGFARPRPRRASESSVMEKDRRPRMDRDGFDSRPRTESEEQRRRERRKEREERHKQEKEKIRRGEKKPRKPQGLDIIDKLDVTGIYGQGLFHHDGPFDACNPHRNAKKDRKAPMQAFPADSANMQLGGAGPLRSRLDLDRFHGRGEESFSEFAVTRKPATTVIDPLQRTEPVHGAETFGLGTSTFLEGAPASRSALQRRDSEDPELNGGGGGLSRKKSLAQRFRGMSASRRDRPGDLRSPDARYQIPAQPNGACSPEVQQLKASSAGGPVQARHNKENEVNVFDNDYEAAFNKKGAQIKIAEQDKPSMGRPRATSSPKAPALSRSLTSDGRLSSRGRGSSGEEDRPEKGGVSGFLNRMRSVKGGPRRPTRNVE